VFDSSCKRGLPSVRVCGAPPDSSGAPSARFPSRSMPKVFRAQAPAKAIFLFVRVPIHCKEIVQKASAAVRATKHHGNAPIRRLPSAHLSWASPNVKNESAIETNVHPATTAGAPARARFPNHEVPSHSTRGARCPVTIADTPTQPGGITNTDTIRKTIVVCAQVGNCSSCKGMIFILSAAPVGAGG
jgi:hypothetical protein